MSRILLCACARGVKSEISLDTGSEIKTKNPVGVDSCSPDPWPLMEHTEFVLFGLDQAINLFINSRSGPDLHWV